MKRETVVSIALFLILAGFAVRGANDPDLWWHLATGRLISNNLANGQSLAAAIPHADPFSFSFAGAPWIAHEWLTDVIMYQVHKLAGLPGLMVLFGLVIGLAYWIMFDLAKDQNMTLAAVATIAAAVISVGFWGPRPQMVNLLFTAITLSMLLRWRGGNIDYALAIPLVVMVWANMHSGFMIGIVLPVVFLLADIVEGLVIGQGDHNYPSHLVLICCCIAAAANPYGFKLLLYPFQTLASAVMQTHILEWQSPDFHLWEYRLFAAAIFSGLIIIAKSPKMMFAPVVLFCGAAAAGLISVRNIPLFALVAIPVITTYGAELRFARKTADQRFARKTSLAVLSMALALALAIAFRTIKANQDMTAERFPVAAVDFLEAIGASGPMFNEYQFGGYLIWRGWPVYIDGRADVYGDHLLEYLELSNARDRRWQQTLADRGIDTALLYADSPLLNVMIASGEWIEVYRDQQSAVVLRAKHLEK